MPGSVGWLGAPGCRVGLGWFGVGCCVGVDCCVGVWLGVWVGVEVGASVGVVSLGVLGVLEVDGDGVVGVGCWLGSPAAASDGVSCSATRT